MVWNCTFLSRCTALQFLCFVCCCFLGTPFLVSRFPTDGGAFLFLCFAIALLLLLLPLLLMFL